MTDPLPPLDWPFRTASRIVALRPHRWHVQVVGEGPDVLLLHGAGASSHTWEKLAPFLKGHRLILVDLPGHGWTRSPRGTARLGDVANDLARLCAAEGWTPEVIVGHSAGAAIALEIARQGKMPVRHVVALNGALENFRGAAGWLFPMMAKMLALNPLTGFLISHGRRSRSQVEAILGSAGSHLDARGLDLYAQLISRRIHVEGTLSMMAQWSLDGLSRALPEIDVPVLFIHGEKDGAVDVSVAERAAAQLPKATLHVLPGVGHLSHEEAPKHVADLMASLLHPLPA